MFPFLYFGQVYNVSSINRHEALRSAQRQTETNNTHLFEIVSLEQLRRYGNEFNGGTPGIPPTDQLFLCVDDLGKSEDLTALLNGHQPIQGLTFPQIEKTFRTALSRGVGLLIAHWTERDSLTPLEQPVFELVQEPERIRLIVEMAQRVRARITKHFHYRLD
jgi:hypothetical protein